MKKTLKLSLVTAVAVAGISSSVSAKPLSEAIKNTDLSGYIRYRYTNGELNKESNNYKISVTTKSKVNDMVTAKLKVVNSGTSTNEDGDVDLEKPSVKEANFIIKAAGATIITGKQALATPFADSDEQQGTGIVVLKPINKQLTLAGGWYTNSDAQAGVDGADIGANNIAAIAAIVNAGPANIEAWYANVDETALNGDDANQNTWAPKGIDAGAKAINLNAKVKAGIASVELNYASVDYSSNVADVEKDLGNPKQTRVIATIAPTKEISITAGVVKAGKDGGDVTLGESGAKANIKIEKFSATGLTDTTAYILGAKYKAGKISAGVKYGKTSDVDGQTAGDVAFSELKVCASYAMSKNFNISGWVTTTGGDNGNDKKGQNRIEIKYTF